VFLPVRHRHGGGDRALQERVRYIAIDGDEFEEKNLGRQLCIRPDMGKNKAEVIVGRYASAFGVGEDCASFLDAYIRGLRMYLSTSTLV
jgi:hypothetical protein